MTAYATGKPIDENARKVLINSITIEKPNLVRITSKLDRKDYSNVNEALNSLGGVWNRKLKAHVFDGRAFEQIREDIDNIVTTGRVIRDADMGWFATPTNIADGLVDLLNLKPGNTVLEPSAGDGALIKAVLRKQPNVRVTAIEKHGGRAAALESLSRENEAFGRVIVGDFLDIGPREYGMPLFDRVIMNPPFAPNRADISHVRHALSFLKPHGTLVAVMAGGLTFREDERTKSFKLLVNVMRGEIRPLPSGSFKASGTNVETVYVKIEKEEHEKIG